MSQISKLTEADMKTISKHLKDICSIAIRIGGVANLMKYVNTDMMDEVEIFGAGDNLYEQANDILRTVDELEGFIAEQTGLRVIGGEVMNFTEGGGDGGRIQQRDKPRRSVNPPE